MKRIAVIDCTLSKLETGANSLLLREKTAAASILDSCGADMIELPVLKKTREGEIILKTVSSSVERSSVLFTAKSVNDITDAGQIIRQTPNARVQVVLPVSTVQMEYIFHIKDEKMLVMIADTVSKAAELGAGVIFSAMDATRADRAFLIKACCTAVEKGAEGIVLSDTSGTALPDGIKDIVSDVKKAVGVPVYADVSDRIHLAAACALSAVEAGADGVRCSSYGDDVLNTVEFADLIADKGLSLGVTTGLDVTKTHRDITDFIRTVKSDPKDEKSDGTGSDILLDYTSSITDVAQAVSKLGYNLSDEDVGKVHFALSNITDKKGTVGARELEALVASYAMQVRSTYHLVGYNASCSNMTSSMAHIVLLRADEKLDGVAAGDGPIDAAFRAIEQIIGYHYELDDFQIRAVTEGREALGEALVRLRSEGKLYSGVGISTDIVGSSIRAYLNALNKIVAGENKG